MYVLLALPDLGTTKCSRIILHIAQPYNQPFVQKVLVPFLENGARNKIRILAMLVGSGVSLSLSPQLREQEKCVCVCVHMHIYTLTYIYINNICIYIYVYKYMHSHTLCVYVFK